MKIIKQGLSREELVKLHNVIKRFECKYCGCIFEADKSEYKSEEEYIYTHYYSYCPNCGNVAFENKMI